jgi:serine/threonine protein kinase
VRTDDASCRPYRQRIAQLLSRRTANASCRFVRGRTLLDATRTYHKWREAGEAGPLELPELLNAFVGVCNAVAYAHSRGVIPRDLRGQNVVLGDHGEVMVLDWGLAKVLHAKGDGEATPETPPPVVSEDSGLRGATLHRQVLGTPGYMAPEQAEGRQDLVGERTELNASLAGSGSVGDRHQIRALPGLPGGRNVPDLPAVAEPGAGGIHLSHEDRQVPAERRLERVGRRRESGSGLAGHASVAGRVHGDAVGLGPLRTAQVGAVHDHVVIRCYPLSQAGGRPD